jgi:hypothetical protein
MTSPERTSFKDCNEFTQRKRDLLFDLAKYGIKGVGRPMKLLSLADKLSLNKFEVNEGEPHILINQEACKSCIGKSCLTACPAGLYSEQNGDIIVDGPAAWNAAPAG